MSFPSEDDINVNVVSVSIQRPDPNPSPGPNPDEEVAEADSSDCSLISIREVRVDKVTGRRRLRYVSRKTRKIYRKQVKERLAGLKLPQEEGDKAGLFEEFGAAFTVHLQRDFSTFDEHLLDVVSTRYDDCFDPTVVPHWLRWHKENKRLFRRRRKSKSGRNRDHKKKNTKSKAPYSAEYLRCTTGFPFPTSADEFEFSDDSEEDSDDEDSEDQDSEDQESDDEESDAEESGDQASTSDGNLESEPAKAKKQKQKKPQKGNNISTKKDKMEQKRTNIEISSSEASDDDKHKSKKPNTRRTAKMATRKKRNVGKVVLPKRIPQVEPSSEESDSGQ